MRNALNAAAVSGMGLVLAVGLVLGIILLVAPLVVVWLWHTGQMSFEVAVIVLLVLAIYAGGGSND